MHIQIACSPPPHSHAMQETWRAFVYFEYNAETNSTTLPIQHSIQGRYTETFLCLTCKACRKLLHEFHCVLKTCSSVQCGHFSTFACMQQASIFSDLIYATEWFTTINHSRCPALLDDKDHFEVFQPSLSIFILRQQTILNNLLGWAWCYTQQDPVFGKAETGKS